MDAQTEVKSRKDKRDKKDKKDKKDKRDKKDKKRKREGTDDAVASTSASAEPVAKKTKSSSPSTSRQFTESDFTYSNPTEAAKASEWREQNNIHLDNCDDTKVFRPVYEFNELCFPEDLMAAVKGFSRPTPIQSQCWPIILCQRDIIGIAVTGSGKTLAFSLPILNHIRERPRQKNPVVLVLAPTRELAKQTSDVCEAAGAASKIRTVCLYGGVPKDAQRAALREGVEIVVATPGRLIDLANDGVLDLSHVKYLVLDEADRMLDMGFEKDIRAIVKMLHSDRQTLMFSATWPEVIQKLAHDFLSKPVKVTIGSADLSANRSVQQVIEVLDAANKDARLLDLLRKYHASKTNRVIVFALYKKEAIRLEEFLNRKGYKAQGLHADKKQWERTQALEQFKDGSKPLLVATDVAARGLDIPNVEFVINYTFPLTIEDYVHRIGRTGRAGKTGLAHTFFTKFDKAHAGSLVGVLKDAGQSVPEDLLQFGSFVKPKEAKIVGPIEVDAKSAGHLTFDDE